MGDGTSHDRQEVRGFQPARLTERLEGFVGFTCVESHPAERGVSVGEWGSPAERFLALLVSSLILESVEPHPRPLAVYAGITTLAVLCLFQVAQGELRSAVEAVRPASQPGRLAAARIQPDSLCGLFDGPLEISRGQQNVTAHEVGLHARRIKLERGAGL